MDKRLFIAVKYCPNEEILHLINELKEKFKGEKIKFVDVRNIHLTLKFLGDTDELLIDDISNVFKEISYNFERITMSIIGVEAFFRKSIPAIIYLKTKFDKHIINLSKDINLSLKKLAFAVDKRKFIPHITLARIKYLKDIQDFENHIKHIQFKSYNFNIDSFELIESKLYPEGPVYQTLGSFHFPI